LQTGPRLGRISRAGEQQLGRHLIEGHTGVAEDVLGDHRAAEARPRATVLTAQLDGDMLELGLREEQQVPRAEIPASGEQHADPRGQCAGTRIEPSERVPLVPDAQNGEARAEEEERVERNQSDPSSQVEHLDRPASASWRSGLTHAPRLASARGRSRHQRGRDVPNVPPAMARAAPGAFGQSTRIASTALSYLPDTESRTR
jgi:hypothetical protein